LTNRYPASVTNWFTGILKPSEITLSGPFGSRSILPRPLAIRGRLQRYKPPMPSNPCRAPSQSRAEMAPERERERFYVGRGQNCSCSQSKCCALELNFRLIAITPRSLQKVGRFVRLPTQIDPVPNGQQLNELDPIPNRIDKS